MHYHLKIKERGDRKSPLLLSGMGRGMDVVSKIRQLAESKLTNEGHFIVDVIYLPKQHPAKLKVILDGDKGITIDDCATLSREISNVLDEQDVVDSAYLLEVTTPGLDHPLKLKRQYVKNTGRQLRVTLQNKTLLEGKLIRADESGLVLELIKESKKAEPKSVEIPFAEIEKAFVMVSFK